MIDSWLTRWMSEEDTPENFEKAMDALFTDYDFRHAERDEYADSEAQRYSVAMHEPHRPMGGAEHDRP